MINKIRELLKGKKSYLVAVSGIVGALLGFSVGELTLIQTITAILGACGLGSIRAAISKVIE